MSLSANPDGRAVLVADEALNSSDKSLIPSGTLFAEVQSVWVEFTSDATAGSRQLVVQVQDASGDVVFEVRAGLTQAASLTKKYAFAPQLPDMAVFRDGDYLATPLPKLLVPPNYRVRVYDNKAIAAGTDDMNVQILCRLWA